MQSGRCLGGVTSSFRASESDVTHFSWVVWRCVFVWFWACSDGGLLLRKRLLWMHLRGFEACSDGGVPLRTRRPGMHLEASLLVVALAV